MHQISCSKSLHMFKLHLLQVVKINQSISKQYYLARSDLWFWGKLDFHSPSKLQVCVDQPSTQSTLPQALALDPGDAAVAAWNPPELPALAIQSWKNHEMHRKTPQSPTFNIDFDTNKKVEKMKKMKSSLEVWVSLERTCKKFKELQQCIPKEHQGFNPKNSCLTFGASFQKIASMVRTMLQVFTSIVGSIGIFCKCEDMGKLKKFEITSGLRYLYVDDTCGWSPSVLPFYAFPMEVSQCKAHSPVLHGDLEQKNITYLQILFIFDGFCISFPKMVGTPSNHLVLFRK